MYSLRIFHYGLFQGVEQPAVLCGRTLVAPFCAHHLASADPHSVHPPAPRPPWQPPVCSLRACSLRACSLWVCSPLLSQVNSLASCFRFHTWVMSHAICVSLPDFLPSVWSSLGLSTLLQVTLFHCLDGWLVFHCSYGPIFFTHSSVEGRLGCELWIALPWTQACRHLSRPQFAQILAQEWACWATRQLRFQEPPCCFRESVGHLYVFFGGTSTYFFCPWFSWVVFHYWIVWAVCVFWKLSPCRSHHLWYFLFDSRRLFHFVDGFLCCAKAYQFDEAPFVYLAFIFIALGDWPKKTLLLFMSENVCLLSLLGALWCHVSSLNLKPFWVCFCVWCENVLTSLVHTQLSSVPAPLAEEAAFSALCVLTSFIEN